LPLKPIRCSTASSPAHSAHSRNGVPHSSKPQKRESILVCAPSPSREDKEWKLGTPPQGWTRRRHRLSLQLPAVLIALISGQALASLAQTTPEPKPSAPTDEKVVISIGDQKITAKEVNKLLESMPPQYRPFYSGPGRRQLADIIVDNRLQAEEAEKRGLEKTEDVKMKINIARQSILTAAGREQLEKEIAVTDEALQKYLDEHVNQFEEARVKRIIIRSKTSVPFDPAKPAEGFPSDEEARAKADEIHKKLLEGGDFEELAAKFSNDPMTSGKGGDMGFIRRGNQAQLVVPPVENEIFSIKIGTITEVMRTALGYEIVKVEERRVPKLSDIRKEIEAAYRKQKVEEWLKERKSHYTIQIDDAFFKATKASGMTQY
jgi:peptidyl-prolyl cis-trans isomerase C